MWLSQLCCSRITNGLWIRRSLSRRLVKWRRSVHNGIPATSIWRRGWQHSLLENKARKVPNASRFKHWAKRLDQQSSSTPAYKKIYYSRYLEASLDHWPDSNLQVSQPVTTLALSNTRIRELIQERAKQIRGDPRRSRKQFIPSKYLTISSLTLADPLFLQKYRMTNCETSDPFQSLR